MKIGLCLNNLGSSQLAAEAIAWADRAAADGRDDVVLFYEALQRPCVPTTFMTTQIADAYGFDGVLVATDVSTAGKIANFPSAQKKIFHVWDLEWTRRPFAFRDLLAAYADPRLILTARSADHALAVSNAWNTPVSVAPTLNLVPLAENLAPAR